MTAASHDQGARVALLVDRHPLWLGALERLLEANGFSVDAKLNSAREAIEVVRATELDLVVTDLDTTDGDSTGLQVLAAARDAGVCAIVLSAHEDPESIEGAFAAGAAAYVLKSAEPSEVTVATRQAFSDVRSLYTSVPGAETVEADPGTEHPLTPRETEVLALAAEGRSNGEIASSLRVTEQTVKLHLANTYRKLGVANRTQAANRARELGLASGNSSGQVELHLLASPVSETGVPGAENPD